MARLIKPNHILSGLSGKIGDIVVKQYDYGTVVSKYPDMSNVKWTELQKLRHSRFKEAVSFAQRIMRDKKERQKYEKKLKKGERLYHKLISEYLRK